MATINVDPKTVEKMADLVRDMDDADLHALLVAIRRTGLVVIPNWFLQAHVEELSGTVLAPGELAEFAEWCHYDANWADKVSEQAREYWDVYQAEVLEDMVQNGEDEDEVAQ